MGLGEVGAQARGQSENCPCPWEDWEAGATSQSQPQPLQSRVILHQDYSPPPFYILSLGFPSL